jgi:arginine-tRNA-protein transferase
VFRNSRAILPNFSTTEDLDAFWEKDGDISEFFFRYSTYKEGNSLFRIIPLRINLDNFLLRKSQQRIWRRNSDLEIQITPSFIDEQRRLLFSQHKERFKINIPDTLEDFLGDYPSFIPCKNLEFSLSYNGKIIAASYLDIGKKAVSSVYAMYNPEYSKRSLGIYTMLLEIMYAKKQGFQFYYHGYATIESSEYDYKRRFNCLEYYDWLQNIWLPLAPEENR